MKNKEVKTLVMDMIAELNRSLKVLINVERGLDESVSPDTLRRVFEVRKRVKQLQFDARNILFESDDMTVELSDEISQVSMLDELDRMDIDD